MHFDSSISLGTLLGIGTIVFTFYKFHIANVRRFMTIELRVDQMWGENLRKLEEIHKSTNGNLDKVNNRLETANNEITNLRLLLKDKYDLSK